MRNVSTHPYFLPTKEEKEKYFKSKKQKLFRSWIFSSFREDEL
jgi:hypothetical protein